MQYYNPYFQNPYNPMINAQNRLAQLEQQYPQNNFNQQMPMNQNIVPQNGLNGRVVDAVENVTANDVPMDGSVAYFPKSDRTEIYSKSWNADGTIRTTVYKPVLDGQTEKSPSEAEKAQITLSDEATTAFMERFDEIESRFDKLEKQLGRQTTGRVKKEVAKDE